MGRDKGAEALARDVTKHTKTFVRVGEPPSTDRTWAEPVGLALGLFADRRTFGLHKRIVCRDV